jgi:hypothetical protein
MRLRAQATNATSNTSGQDLRAQRGLTSGSTNLDQATTGIAEQGQNADGDAQAGNDPEKRNRGRPSRYPPGYKALCEKHYKEWRKYYAEWKEDPNSKGSARAAFAKSKNMSLERSDAMIRYGTPPRKKSRRK